MRVLISSEEAAGTLKPERTDLFDFHHTIEGELLTLPPLVCDGLEEYRVKCGCGRAFTGATSARACTVGVVAEWDEAEALEALMCGDLAVGWHVDQHKDLAEGLWADVESLAVALGEEFDLGEHVVIRSQPHTFRLGVARAREAVAS